MKILTAVALLAALAAGSQAALAQTGTEKAWCLQGAQTSGALKLECRYDTMAQCEQAAKGQATAKCVTNPKATATTPPKTTK